MNYLAHLALAQPNGRSLAGNLMGDFMKGVKIKSLPMPIQKGIANHRAVDRFTDSHADVLALKPLFSQRYRRFAGVMIDISFDYFLTKHWQRFYAQPHQDFVQHCYERLLTQRAYMPIRMKKTVEHMAEDDWLSGYKQFERVGFALDKVAERIRFRNDFSGSGSEVVEHYAAIEAAFLALYPALQAHIVQQGIEQVMESPADLD